MPGMGGTLPFRSRRSTRTFRPICNVRGRDLRCPLNVNSRRSITRDEQLSEALHLGVESRQLDSQLACIMQRRDVSASVGGAFW